MRKLYLIDLIAGLKILASFYKSDESIYDILTKLVLNKIFSIVLLYIEPPGTSVKIDKFWMTETPLHEWILIAQLCCIMQLGEIMWKKFPKHSKSNCFISSRGKIDKAKSKAKLKHFIGTWWFPRTNHQFDTQFSIESYENEFTSKDHWNLRSFS